VKKVTMSEVPTIEAEMTGGLMTGTQVYRQPILEPGESSNFNFSIVKFSAGSRNKFHKHSGDQILVITEGTGTVATDDETLTVTEGDVVLIPARENHWHGAPDNTSMAHITITVANSQTEQTEA
jgi:quercetin dioxygenase-like cupin family protein